MNPLYLTDARVLEVKHQGVVTTNILLLMNTTVAARVTMAAVNADSDHKYIYINMNKLSSEV